MIKNWIGIVLVLVFFVSSAFIIPLSDPTLATSQENDPPFLLQSSTWADSVFNTLTPDERIAQLFMVAAYSNKGETHVNHIKQLVREHKIGGLIFMQGGPVRQAKLINAYQELSSVPLMVAIDGEWGLAMRLDSTVKYPWQMTLGAIQDEQLIYDMGVDIAKQCQRLGIHINFAPVVDVNVNPKNPIINARSFGEDKANVASKGIAYMKGMQSIHVMANAKHFPGHGDTDKDSHKSLPAINHSKQRMDSVELYPFKQLIGQGLTSMMVAHLYIPAYVKEFNQATTLSKNVVTHLLQDTLGFKGLIFTDALNMKGVSSFYRPGVVDVKAFLAGNDVLLFSEDVPNAIVAINKAINEGVISREEVDQRCLKILRAKAWMGLDKHQPVVVDSLYQALNTPAYELLNQKLSEAAITVVQNKNELLPLRRLDTLRIAALAVGGEASNAFQPMLGNYAQVDCFAVEQLEDNDQALLDTLRNYNLVLVSIHKSDKNPWKSYRIKNSTKNFIAQLNEQNKVILTVFANPYSLLGFDAITQTEALIMGYQNNRYAQEGVAQVIFGGLEANGKLPVSVSNTYTAGTGVAVNALGRFAYTVPEELGIASKDLLKIDSIALNGIQEHAYPGCQVFVAKEGKVIYHKAFGYHTYENKRAVKKTDIYDLASITKIASSMLAAMQLDDQGKFNLDLNLCDYLPQVVHDTSIYLNLNLREMLAHQAGLQAWVPFYIKTMEKGLLKPEIYSETKSTEYPHTVAKDLYISQGYPDTIYHRILRGPLKERTYRYSDLGYYFLKRIIEHETGDSLQHVVAKVYNQLGMTTTGYYPKRRFRVERIPPTEYDLIFRKQLIHGDVHDPGAAMLGGVGGHAGLFSNANDLAKLMQMYMKGGVYGGERYLQDTTVKEYTSRQFCEGTNRRAAGFDKPFLQGYGGPTCDSISQTSFGHSGFTGTIAWADPEEEVVYVFLSNRIYPDANNKKLLEMNIRTDIQQVVYDAIRKSGKLY